jgi:hypothetical protein
MESNSTQVPALLLCLTEKNFFQFVTFHGSVARYRHGIANHWKTWKKNARKREVDGFFNEKDA